MKISGNKVVHINGIAEPVYPVGAIYTSVKLETAHMPSHSHTVNGGSHSHYISNCSAAGSGGAQRRR